MLIGGPRAPFPAFGQMINVRRLDIRKNVEFSCALDNCCGCFEFTSGSRLRLRPRPGSKSGRERCLSSGIRTRRAFATGLYGFVHSRHIPPSTRNPYRPSVMFEGIVGYRCPVSAAIYIGDDAVSEELVVEVKRLAVIAERPTPEFDPEIEVPWNIFVLERPLCWRKLTVIPRYKF